MATNAFGGLGLQQLGQENYTSGSGLDLGRALLAMGISKSGLESKLNDWGLSAKNGQLGFNGVSSTNPTGSAPVGAVVPLSSSQMSAGSNWGAFGEAGKSNVMSDEDAKKTLMNEHEPVSSITPSNDQQMLASNVSMPPPSPIMGGVVPPSNDYTNGAGLRDKLAQYAAFA
jgi:hypothetical protein